LDAGVAVTNEATITTTTPDANPLNNTATSTTRVTYADVFVRKEVSPTAPVLAGEVLTWTISFGNAGDAVARDVRLVDVLPSGAQASNPFTYTYSITSSSTTTLPYTYTITSTSTLTNATWLLGDLPPNTSGQVVFTMTANAATGLDALLVNSVAISTSTLQTNTTNDTARTTNPKLDLGVSKLVARNPVAVGEWVSYTLTVYNNGSSALSRVALTDTYDAAHLQFVSASRAPDGNSVGQLVWNNIGPIAIDARASVIVTFTALQPVSETVNRVTASGQFTGSSVLTVTDSARLRITQPVLSVSKASSAGGAVQPGQRITYTLTISNSGDADAVGVTLSDILPANTIGANFNVSGITVSANSQMSFTYSITALSPLISGTQIVNSVSITSPNSNVLTPTATVTDTVGSTHALQITKTAQPAVVVAGGLVTYTLAYAITGNEPAPDVTISDALPTGVSLVAASPIANSQSANTLVWALGTVNPPLSGVITVVVSVPSSVPSGMLLDNTATLTDASGLRAQAPQPRRLCLAQTSTSSKRLSRALWQMAAW
ncbi:MAG: DUF11 domain-containing protein, partial [Anaerolineae bacterium]|nr:DUF11 domain-containing protein [Anaerolineae bacterium]